MQKFADLYNLNLIISEHFDVQINVIDIRAEELICRVKTTFELDEINEERDKLIVKIESLRDSNLAKNVGTQEYFERKWHHIMMDSKMSYQSKLDYMKSDCIGPDCFLVKDTNYVLGYSLWVTCWFNEREHVEFRFEFLFC